MNDPIDGEIVEPEDSSLDEVDRQGLLDRTDLQMVLITMRRRAGLKQEDVNRIYGIDQSQLSDLERGRVTRPHKSTLRRLAAAYAEHIPGSDAEWVYRRLEEARDRGADWSGSHDAYDASRILLRIDLYPDEIRRWIWHMVDVMLDGVDIILRVARRSGQD